MTLFPDAGLVPVITPPAAPPGTFRFRLSEHSRCFDGHFDGMPILPGVVHLALALTACATQTGRVPLLTGLRDVRMMRPLGPGDEVAVILTDGPEPFSVRFEVRRDDEPMTVGLLLMAPPDDPSDG